MRLVWELAPSRTYRGAQKWRWQVRAGNNRLVAASSEGYRRRIDAARNAMVFGAPADLLSPGVDRVACSR